MHPFISVIIPVYRAETTIRRCIDSVLSQSFTDWELLLVDDGSPDKSGNICEEYSQQDSRIKVFHKTNGGVSSARNLGLEHAHGDWLTFIDADDYIDDYYFNCVLECGQDLLLVQNIKVQGYLSKGFSDYLEPLVVSSSEELREFVTNNLSHRLLTAPWGKFYKSSLIGSLRFDQHMKVCEDTVFVQSYLIKCSSLQIVDKTRYVYFDEYVNFAQKYRMSCRDAITHLQSVYQSFQKLDIINDRYLATQLSVFEQLCKFEWQKNTSLWYGAAIVKNISMEIYPSLSKIQKLKYQYLKYPICGRIYNCISVLKSKIKNVNG